MNVVFAGTPAFALPSLEALHVGGHRVVAVYTQPDRPSGRGRKTVPGPIKQYALAHHLPLRQPSTLRGEAQSLAALAPDVLVVVAYGALLPAAVLAVPRHGCINVHASLLPCWRGAAPIARAIEAGDRETGITIMQMEAGLDTGPILLQAPAPIGETDTTATLEPRLAVLGAATLGRALGRLAQGALTPRPQDAAQACYAPKLQKSEAPMDWSQPAARLHRKIRALNPWPVASTTWRAEVLRLWDAAPPASHGAGSGAAPGTVTAAGPEGIEVQTGEGRLRLTRVQAAGGRVLSAEQFLNGYRLRPGDRFGT